MAERFQDPVEPPTSTRSRKGLFVLIGCLIVGSIGCSAAVFVGVLWLTSREAETISASVVERHTEVECQSRLHKLWGHFMVYEAKRGRLPRESGVRFLAAPLASGAVVRKDDRLDVLTCPGVELGDLALAGVQREQWWTDLDVLDGSWSAYAGRDQARYPLERMDGHEPLAACDNVGGMHHADVTHVLYADGKVERISLDYMRSEGVVDRYADVLVVGPDSPLDDLQKLSLD